MNTKQNKIESVNLKKERIKNTKKNKKDPQYKQKYKNTKIPVNLCFWYETQYKTGKHSARIFQKKKIRFSSL